MNMQRFVWAIFITTFAFLTGCISVSVGPKGAEKSKGVEFTPPKSPFESLNDAKADAVWINKKNGNSISYLSTCNDPADPTIETATRELFADLKDLNMIKSQTEQFHGREALLSEVEGKSEGVLTKINSLVFKKNGCLYTISLVGLAKSFEADKSQFEKFVAGFEAP
jgi:hypothetical protein